MVGPWPLRLHIIGADLSRTTNSSPEEGYSTFFRQTLFFEKNEGKPEVDTKIYLSPLFNSPPFLAFQSFDIGVKVRMKRGWLGGA